MSAPETEKAGQAGETGRTFDRGEVSARFGAPTEQLGSVNDPRCHLDQGLEWNEKWIYCSPTGGAVERIVLWNRYDLLGVFRVDSDGSLVAEPLAEGDD